MIDIPKDAPVMSDLRILVAGLPNTGKSTVAVLLASFLRNHGFPDVTVADDEPYDFNKLAACEMSLRDKRPCIVVETLQMRRSVHLADTVAEAVSATESSEAKLREALVKLDAETYQHVKGWRRSDTGNRIFSRDLTDAVNEEGENCGPWLRVKNEYAGCWAWSFYLDYVHRSHAHGQQSNAWDAMVAAEAAYARWKAEQ